MNTTQKQHLWKDFTRANWKFKRTYKVSRDGVIKRIKKSPNDKDVRIYILGGYENFSEIKKDSKTDLMYVHRVVAELFLDPDPNRLMVIHKDFDKSNNCADNLKYATRLEMEEHHRNNPVFLEKRKLPYYTPKNSKLNVKKVQMIKRKIFDPNRKTRMKMIAKQFGISEMQLYRIKSGENWGHVTDY
ncbi:MAG: HNH endonuclease [Flavobacteriaceae bacterium]|nr:HNH endonuclease [Flavobacteriaceae bacterium]